MSLLLLLELGGPPVTPVDQLARERVAAGTGGWETGHAADDAASVPQHAEGQAVAGVVGVAGLEAVHAGPVRIDPVY